LEKLDLRDDFQEGGLTMAYGAMDAKEEAHELIDKMSVRQVVAAVGLFRATLDPVEVALARVPYDEEALSADGVKALDDAQDWLKSHDPIPHEHVLAELGITQEEIESYGAGDL
jgi:hypothetical protein